MEKLRHAPIHLNILHSCNVLRDYAFIKMVQSKQFYMGENFRRKNKLRLQESSRYKHLNQNVTNKLSFLYYNLAYLRS